MLRGEPFRGAFFKRPVAKKVVRGLKRRKAASLEDKQKAEVRQRDGYCRFPLCGCRRFKLRLEVAHASHKGIGGNPRGDRSDPRLMILLCSARHKENDISLDRKTIRIRALDPRRDFHGPCAWDVDLKRMRLEQPGAWVGGRPQWCEVARESGPHCLEPLSAAQKDLLKALAGMQL